MIRAKEGRCEYCGRDDATPLFNRITELEEVIRQHQDNEQEISAKVNNIDAIIKRAEQAEAELKKTKNECRENEMHHYQLGKEYGRLEQVDMAHVSALEAENKRLNDYLKKIAKHPKDLYGSAAILAEQCIQKNVFITTFCQDTKNAHYLDKDSKMDHIADKDCWCEPEDFGDGLWVHRDRN